MKGILFNSLEAYLKQKWGEEKTLTLLEDSDLKTRDPFVGPMTYPDEDFSTLIEKSARALGKSIPDFLRDFGASSFHFLAGRYSKMMEPFKSAKDLLSQLNLFHRDEVIKLYPDADFPHFECEEPAPDRLIFHYCSRRKLCFYLEGILVGVARHFQETIEQRQTACMLEGGKECCFDLTFSKAKS